MNGRQQFMNAMIEGYSSLIRAKHINQRKKHVFKDNLQDLHNKFVLFPADKAVNNVIVVCRNIIWRWFFMNLMPHKPIFKIVLILHI